MNPQDKQEILERLGRLRADSARRWGRMTAAQMLCHLSDSFQAKLGERGSSSASNFLTRTLVKWIALQTPLPWAHSVKTMPENDQEIGGTPPAEFERDRERLVAAIERFTVPMDAAALKPHPYFGDMSHAEWMRWGYLHCDHHLRQFGL
ncbi:MAG: DUF1569 domain-containing protein [Blastocatellia bacterium]|nr:DUF1569 domain-containing protein [Blastocatellia bacterium]